MSALRRSGYGFSDGQSYGRYYGAGGGDVPDHTPPPLYSPRPEPPQTPVSWRARGGGPGETTWSGEGGGVSDGYYRVQLERPGGSHQCLRSVHSIQGSYQNPDPGIWHTEQEHEHEQEQEQEQESSPLLEETSKSPCQVVEGQTVPAAGDTVRVLKKRPRRQNSSRPLPQTMSSPHITWGSVKRLAESAARLLDECNKPHTAENMIVAVMTQITINTEKKRFYDSCAMSSQEPEEQKP